MPLRLLLFIMVRVFCQQQPTMTNAPASFGPPSLYDLIQRQNQLNNALLYNHVLINNQMVAGIQDNQPPTFPPFPQQPPNIPPLLYPSHMQGLLPHNLATNSAEKLAIYGQLTPMTPSKPGGIAPLPVPAAPVVAGVVQLPIAKETTNVRPFIPAEIKKTHEKEDAKAILRIKAIERAATTMEPAALISTVPEMRAANVNNAFNYLKNLNLTQEENEKLVHIVEQVVREELAKKLAGAENSTRIPSAVPVVPSSASTTPESVPQTDASVVEKENKSTAPEDESIASTTDSEQMPGNGSEDVEEEASTSFDFAGPTAFSIDRSGRLIDTEIPEIKLHPPKRTEYKDESYSTGPIKTSETHLTAIEERAAEEEDKDVRKENLPMTGISPQINIVKVSPTTPRPEAITRVEEFDPKKVRPIPRRSFLETDSDLLALATGAPLDLSDETATDEASYRNRFRATKPPVAPRLYTKTQQIPRLRPSTPPSQFVRLAADYRERLSGSEDVTNMLKKFYENAYVQLVANESNPRKLMKPHEVQYSPGR